MFKTKSFLALIGLALAIVAPASAANIYFSGTTSGDITVAGNWFGGVRPGAGDNPIFGRDTAFLAYTPSNQAVLTSNWATATGIASIRQLIIDGVGNTLTLSGSGQLIDTTRDLAIRNGAMIRVSNSGTGSGPAFIMPAKIHIGENGDVATTTATLRIDNTGYVRINPSSATVGTGTDVALGGACNGVIEIRDDGKLELASGTRLVFFTVANPSSLLKNKVVMSGNAQLIYGDTATASSIQGWINAGLITTDQPDSRITFSGSAPTIIRVGAINPSNAVKNWTVFD